MYLYVLLAAIRISVTVTLIVTSYLPGRSVISASGEHAVSGTVHLPRLQLGGKRDSRDQSEDQRSVVARAACLSACFPVSLPVCLSVCLPVPLASVMPVCLTGCEPP